MPTWKRPEAKRPCNGRSCSALPSRQLFLLLLLLLLFVLLGRQFIGLFRRQFRRLTLSRPPCCLRLVLL